MHVQSLLFKFLSAFINTTEVANVELLCVSIFKTVELHSHERLAIGFPPDCMQVILIESPLM